MTNRLDNVKEDCVAMNLKLGWLKLLDSMKKALL